MRQGQAKDAYGFRYMTHWITEKKINIFGQFALRSHPELTHLPMWMDIAKTEADRQAMVLLLSRLETGRPFFMPPDVPAARVQAVRRAFDATMNDPAFIEDAAKAKLEIDPMTGEDMSKLIADLHKTPPEVVARVRAALDLK